MEIINTIGRRKNAVARIYLKEGSGEIIVNKKKIEDYFATDVQAYVVRQALQLTDTLTSFDIKASLNGGGLKGQAEALRLAISRALCKVNEEHRGVLKSNGLLRRDPRMVERKKPGQKKARKKFQFSKR